VSERLNDGQLDVLSGMYQTEMERVVTIEGRHLRSILDELIERRAADLTAEEREALAFARKVVGASETLFSDRANDPKIAARMERCRAALAVLDKWMLS